MALTIIENFIDPAGYRRVRVQLHDGNTQFFKFAPGMTTDQMKAEVQAWLDAEQARRQAEAAERTRLAQITAACRNFGSLTNQQKATLLDALVEEWLRANV